MAAALARRAARPPRRERVYGEVDGFPGRLAVSELADADAARLGLEVRPGLMYLRLQRERSWTEATRARATRRRGGADTGTFWEDDADWAVDAVAELVPQEGGLLRLRGATHHAETRMRLVEPLPGGLRVDTVLVGCDRVRGMSFPRAR